VDGNRQSTEARGRLRVEQLEDRVSPSIVLLNPGGNTPQGSGANNGQAIVAVNPAGFTPPGQNK
jgi:Planctomycete extracellular